MYYVLDKHFLFVFVCCFCTVTIFRFALFLLHKNIFDGQFEKEKQTPCESRDTYNKREREKESNTRLKNVVFDVIF